MKKLLYIFTIGFGLLTSCEKGQLVENTTYEKLEPGSTKYSYLKFLNASPGSPTINYYINGVKFSAAYTTSGSEIGGFAYNGLFPDLGYATSVVGSQTLTAKTLATATTDPDLEVLNATITPEGGKFYSIFTNGLYNTITKTIPNYTIFEDIKPSTDTSKVFLRLINMYTGGPAIDMVQDATAEKLVTALAVNTASPWISIPNPGQSNKYAFRNSNTNAAISTVTLTATLTKGRAYTIYTRGIFGNTSFPFALGFYTTFYGTIN
jgi:hypothetical protein